jgi:DNA-binding response OmpR family regulator
MAHGSSRADDRAGASRTWGAPPPVGRTRTLDSHASRLRRKLNGASDTAYVLNVWGVGYRLVATAG